MQQNLERINRKIRDAWFLLAGGVILMAIGAAIQRFVSQGLWANPKVVIGLGLLAACVAMGQLIQSLTLRRHPEALKRAEAEEADERNIAIRNRAGRLAFLVSSGLCAMTLLVYSYASAGSGDGFDLLWWALAGLTVLPIGVYAAALATFQQRD